MSLLYRTAAAALVAGGFALGAFSVTTSAQAAPAVAGANSNGALSANSDVVQVREFRRHGNRHGGRGHYNRGRHNDGWYPGAYLGLGVAGAIIGGALSDEYDDGPAYGASYGGSDAAMRRCAAQFRSFEWDTGLYTTYDGDKRLCPYLG